ncbi:BNR repeat-containing protein [Ferruginibacter sp.]|nr:BNR repeat-containing protein [Ferruginibacter sp.]
MKNTAFLLYALCAFGANLFSQTNITSKTVLVGSNGWANNSVNTVVFRKNSLCTYNNTQYISYYNNDGYVVLGKRKIGQKKWQLQTTSFKGNVADAHNSISIITDGDGYLHMAWNHHGNQLHYSKSIAPGSLKMIPETQMTGLLEQKVTYPEFYLLPKGDLIFLYRDGQSGQGNLVINHYNTKEKIWQLRHQNLIDGEKKRNAYWQACVDAKGTIHISWVWRESPDVSSNHDMCYAQSTDGGVTWENSKKEKYTLPITAATAEYVCYIPQKSELINQTSMYADEEGNPFIASYWKDKGDSIPQYHIVYKTGTEWIIQNTGFRKTAFSLSGAGTKRIPISRPQLVCFSKNNMPAIMLIFRDEERGNKISLAVNANINFNSWQHVDLQGMNTGSWEPTFDNELWRQKKQLHLFVQHTQQADGEGKGNIGQQPVYVTEIKIK